MSSIICVCLSFLALVNSGVINRSEKPVSQISDALKYLNKFGYMNTGITTHGRSSPIVSAVDFTIAVKDFQNFAHIPATGELDTETIKLMNTPRCGVKDHPSPEKDNARRKKRYVLQGSRWKNRDLTYRITKYPDYLTKAEVDLDMQRSFDVWAEVANIRFRQSTDPLSNIEIQFVAGDHGDGDPFDGPGGTLAHAYFPIYGGDVHFDLTEEYTTKSFSGTNLYQVATHEIGHSLGLSHTNITHALMAPFYRGYVPDIELHDDDIKGIQALYGPNVNYKSVNSQVPSVQSESGVSNVCSLTSFDAITTLGDRRTYVFKGSLIYKLTDAGGLVLGYPHRIADDFPGLPNDVDAVLTYFNGVSYVFKGASYWKMVDMKVSAGYPRDISKGFPNVPSDLDAAFVWGGNSRIYFFKGKQYWKFDQTKKEKQVQDGYPKDISIWTGIPDSIDGAILDKNGFTYFFKGGQYWRFNDATFQVDNGGEVRFPRLTAKYWYGCKM